MRRDALGVVLVAALVVLAGCSGFGGNASPTASGTPAGDTPGDGDVGNIEFYISDEPNAIEDFRHLNVTITKVGLHRVGDANGSTATPTVTATPANTTTNNSAGLAAAANTTTPTEEPDEANETDEPDEREEEPDETNETDEEDEREDEPDEANETDEEEPEDEGDGEWIEYEVNKTVDLTRLVGDNATKLDVLEAPSGTYDKVFVYVSDVDATLKNGDSVNVKLPSEKLHINEKFEVTSGSNLSFVFDIAVHKAGKSGKYILQPVVSESGTDVDIDDVDEKDEEREENETEEDDEETEEETEDEETDEEETEEDEADREREDEEREDEETPTPTETPA